MSPTPDTFSRRAGAVLAAFLSGASLAEAARSADLSPRTVQRWVAQGRREPESAHGAFDLALDAIRRGRAIDLTNAAPLSEEELRQVVSEAGRRGSVEALRLYWRMLQAESSGAQPHAGSLEALDELAARRRER